MNGRLLGPSGPVLVRDRESDPPPALVHEEWERAFPWLVQGTTTRRGPAEPDTAEELDMALFGSARSPGLAEGRWERVMAATSMPRAVHARQVHGAVVRAHGAGPVGLEISEECDGHVTDRSGVLLAVTIADCVPVFVVDPERRAVGLAHAGWRGVAAGVLEETLRLLAARYGSAPADLHVHLGPAMCGSCYEVGPEVFAAVGRPEPSAPTPIDLRAVLADRAIDRGVRPSRISVSAHCTRCTGSSLFSHRGGDAGRQIGFLGLAVDTSEGSS